MKNTLFILLAAGLLFFSALLFSQERLTMDYRIGAKDLLQINVLGLAEFNNIDRRVSEDGKITLPLLGEVDVRGLTPSELEKRLAQLLEEKYVQNPQVVVFIREYQSKRVFIMGAVTTPGPIQLLGRQTLKQVISQAGGLAPDAGNEILVTRQLPDQSSTTLRISVEELFLKGDPNLNIPLQAEDIIYIPVDKVVQIYIIGQVRNPGALSVKKSNMPTLLRAIAQAGGFSDRASKSGVIIKRTDETGKETQIKVNVKDIMKGKRKDVPLQENDVIIVPETLF